MDPEPGKGGAQVDPNEIDMGAPEDKPQGDLAADLAAADAANTAVKAGADQAARRCPGRTSSSSCASRSSRCAAPSCYPFVGTTMNDNMIRHYTLGGELAYYLTDVLAVGVEGLYYVHSFREPFDLVARQARRLPTVNEYNWSAALNFHYVPVYGKFAVLDQPPRHLGGRASPPASAPVRARSSRATPSSPASRTSSSCRTSARPCASSSRSG